ncbi:uncharacterized protein KIAA0825-like [Clytia hemisphaerica]|uniref:Uncharacterized protein n=1 Tax=Clytia hemisphaerica TaxID=252671 RepID=A0A7M5XB30_9CNID
MTDSTMELVENVFEKILSSVALDIEELNQLRINIDAKLNDVETQLLQEESKTEDYLTSTNGNSQDHVCDFDSLALQCFLNNVIQAIERNPGQEDYVLSDVIEFCFMNKVALPSHTDDNRVIDNSSLHSIVDKDEEENFLIWKKICKQFRTGILHQMENQANSSKSLIEKHNYKVYLFELLLAIFPFDYVFEDYCQHQTSSLLANLSNSQSETKHESIFGKIGTAIIDLENIAKLQLDLIPDDYTLLQHFTVGEQKFISFKKLLESYDEIIKSQINTFLENYSKVGYNQINFDPALRSTTLVEASTFTAHDVKSFSSVFYILFNWSHGLKTIMKNISKTSSNNDFPIKEESSNGMMYDVFNWKKCFLACQPLLKKVIPMYVHCIFDLIVDTNSNAVLKPVAGKHYMNNPSIPKKISSVCERFLTLVKETIVFTTTSSDRENLQELSEATSTSLNEVFYNYLCQLDENLVECEGNLWKFYQIHCDVSMIIYQMHSYDSQNLINLSSRRGTFVSNLQLCENIFKKCQQKIIQYHLNVLNSSIVFDNHGNNWADEKPFSEGEQCSFTIQMYNFYVRGLVYDLKNTLSVQSAIEILRNIGGDMLKHFATYYSSVQTSYRRVKQFKGDLQVLISIYKWLLLVTSKSFPEITNVEHQSSNYWHVLCKQLYEIMIIICSPLSQVHEFLNDSSNKTHTSLNWYEALQAAPNQQDDSFILDWLCLQLSPNWTSFKFILLHQNGQLARLLVKHTDSLYQPLKTEKQFQSADNQLTRSSHSDTSTLLEPINSQILCKELFGVLYGGPKKPFLHFMASLIIEDDSKSFKISSGNQDLPLWLQLVSDILNPTIQRILNPALELLFAESKYKAKPSFQFTKLQTLPCGCATIPTKESDKFLTGSNLLHKCLMETLQSLVDNFPLLPTRIWDVLVYIKNNPKFSQSWIKLPNLGTKILASILYNWLLRRENMEQTGLLWQDTCDKIHSFAELLWHIIYNLTFDVTENPNISMEIQRNLQSTGNIIQKQLGKLHEYFDKELLEYDADTPYLVDFSKPNLQDGIEISKAEMESLRFLSKIMQINQSTIKQLLQDPDRNIHVQDNLTITKRNQMFEFFQPIEQHRIVNQEEINHFELLEGHVDWDRLIPSVPLSKWRALIYNRFEFQEGSKDILTPEEKEQVEFINMKFTSE